jgi:hypothetical protein
MLYKIIFEDNSEFFGGDLNNSKWNEMPNKSISKIIYYSQIKTIELSGYEEYNHLIVHKQNILSNKNNTIAVILMGKSFNQVTRFIFDLNNNKLLIDKVFEGQEFKDKPTIGWKEGMKNSCSNYKILNYL